MEPNLNEHEVIKFLVAKGGRCTNFELVSNFRGVLNDPHCKAEARLRFKDIINTVATVGEYQNVKYIELKKEHGLNNGVDSPPSSLTSDCSATSYTSPLTQNFQPYWRYRLSTSKQQLPLPTQRSPAYHRSVSEYALADDQVVPHDLSGEFADDHMSQSLPFYNTRGRAVSEPPSHQRRYSSSDGIGLRHQDVGLQKTGYQHGRHDVGLKQTGYHQDVRQQQTGYQHEHQDGEFKQTGYRNRHQDVGLQPISYQRQHQDIVFKQTGYQHEQQDILQVGYHNIGVRGNECQQEDQVIGQQQARNQYRNQDVGLPHVGYLENQPNSNRVVGYLPNRGTAPQDIKLQQDGYQYVGQQPLDDRNSRQQLAGQPPEYWNTGEQNPRLALADHHHHPIGYRQQDRPRSYVGYQQPKQDHSRQQQVGEQHSGQRLVDEKHVAHRNVPRPETSVQRSSSGRRSSESIRESHDDFSRTNPESSFSKRIESLHGIRTNDASRSYSSLPYESPSGYSLSDISPNDLATEDLQTSANLRNVARALFRDPSKSSRRATDDHSSRSEKINSDKNLVGLPNANRQSQRSNANSEKYTDNTSMHSIPNNDRSIGLPAVTRPGSLGESSGPERVASIERRQNIPNRSGSVESIRINHTSNHPVVATDHSSSNRTTDSTSAITNHNRLELADHMTSSPGSSMSLSPRTLQDPKRHSSTSQCSIRSNNSISMISLDSEKELSTNSEIERTTPPPLPPDRKKKLPNADDKHCDSRDDNSLEQDPVACSGGGKVKDRVQHFDDMEKQRRNTKRTHSPLTPGNKENARAHHKAMGIEDDVSISVIEPKLKREWFVKSSQCDYHALSGLLKKEPKLAALKDTAMGYTALHWAAKQGDANVVKLIAGAYKVSPNIRSNGGYTPVHLATLYKHDMIVHLLVHTYGADPSIRDYSGKRADQYPSNYIKVVAGHKTSERRPLKQRSTEPQPKEPSVSNSFMRIGSLNLRKSSRKSTVFASVRGSTRNWGSASELRLGGHTSMRKKLHKSMISAPEIIGEHEKRNDSDSDSTYGFPSKKQDN